VPNPVVVAVDQGTSATKVVVVDVHGRVVGRSAVPVGRADPRPGWVEQDPAEIRDSVAAAVTAALAGLDADVRGVGLSNQRESAVIWDRRTGEPLGPVLGWQDRRTAPRAAALQGDVERIRASTGLPLDPMFSALKLGWLLDEADAHDAARRGDVAVGTIDSWLLHTLTGEHRIEAGNAARTQLLALDTLAWDPALLDLFGVPAACLPEVVRSDAPSAPIRTVPALGGDVRVHGVLGDSHAALYAHGVRGPGPVKATHGTGSSIMGLLGPEAGAPIADGLVRTLAWLADEPAFAFEGTILSSGATVLWLAQVLDLDPGRLGELAATVDDSHGVDLVPAFAGLGAPWWDDAAVAVLSGFGLGTTPAHLARAAVESIALQTEDLLDAVEARLGVPVSVLLADGGPTRNDALMQLQADLGRRAVERSDVAELSATGAAHLAGVSCGLWTADECARLPRERTSFAPAPDADRAAARRERWRGAVARARLRP
jgi:glycerol kinase